VTESDPKQIVVFRPSPERGGQSSHRLVGFGILADLVCALGVASCSRTPVGPLASRSQLSSLAKPVPPPARQAVPSSAPSASIGAGPWVTWEGCAPRLDPSWSALGLLTAFAAECVHGMVPLRAHPEQARLSTGQSLNQAFEIADARGCIRAASAGDAGVELTVLIEEESGRVVDRSPPGRRLTALGAQGPLCLDQPGSYRARATVIQGNGWVALGVWQAQ
jgi:hypothetical protein